MNNRPLLSIGFPVYNGQRYLETTLSSILGQTFTDFVLTISDNGSTDATPEICREFAARDPRVRFHRSESNRGLSWNYNRVLELSSGKYFKWMADDDLYEPEFVERCVDVLERDPDVVLCYTRTVLIDEFGHRVKDWDDGYDIGTSSPSRRLAHLLETLTLSNPVFGVIRPECLGREPFGNYAASDIVLLARLTLYGRFHEVPERLFLRRDHPGKSNRAYPTLDSHSELYDPSTRGKVHLPTLRAFRGHLASVAGAPMSFREKLRCYRLIGRRFRWSRLEVAGELALAARTLVGRAGFARRRSSRRDGHGRDRHGPTGAPG